MLNGKKVVGIITEYNPFHAGHKYMIDRIRDEYHADYIVAAMSGDFVQRGEPAIFDKYERAADALKNGVDLVVQIPVMFSTSSAEDFAAGGVAVLRSLGFVDQLVFGSESADITRLQRMADLELSDGSSAHTKFHAAIRDGVASGMSYPRARAEAMKLILSGDDEDAFESMLDDIRTPASFELKSNDVLGLEYIKAVKRQGDCFSVACIRRNQSLPSAHSIRDAFLQNEQHDMAQSERRTETTHQGYASLDMLSDMLSYRLLQLVYLDSMAPEQSSVMCEYLDVSREIADALRKQVRERKTFRERIAAVKSRNYTYSRISRALLHILLDIQRKDHAALRGAYFGEVEVLPYVRVLGVRKEAKGLMNAISATVVTSPARYQHTFEDFHRKQAIESPEDLILSIRATHVELMFRTDLYAADLYKQIYRAYEAGGDAKNEFTRRFLVVD